MREQTATAAEKITIGVSSCLLGEKAGAARGNGPYLKREVPLVVHMTRL